MVRETRYLWIGNLPDGVTEQRLTELFARHGRVQSVKLHRLESDKLHAVLAFMDIKSAAKAHNSENVIDGLIVQTRYNEPSATASGLPVAHSQEALSSAKPPGTTTVSAAPEQFVWNPAASSSSSSSANLCSASCVGNGPQVSHDERHYHHHHNHHHPNSGLFSGSRCSQKASQKTASSELSNGGCMRNGEKVCLRPSFASSDSCSSSNKMLTDLLSDRRFQCGRFSPTQRLSCTENGLRKSSHIDGDSSTGQENKAICIGGFPANLSDACIKDGLLHQYRKIGKVLSVMVTGQKEERCGIVTFLKREDVLRCLEGNTNERQFLGYPVTISEHEGFESKRADVCQDDYHHKATRMLYVGNLELSVTKEQLQQIFGKYGFLIDVELKSQGQSTVLHAYLQYDSIASVIHAVKDMHNKCIGNNMVKLGYGKTQPTNCLLVDRIVETVSDKILRRLFTRYGQVVHSSIDKESRRCLVYYDSSKHAQRALTELQGKALAGKRIQIDFASKECQSVFYKKLERSGQSVTKHTSSVTLHRSAGSSQSHDVHGRALRDIGLEMGSSRVTDSTERPSGVVPPIHGRRPHLNDSQTQEAVAEPLAIASDRVVIVEKQRQLLLSNRVPTDGDYGRVRLKDTDLKISETDCSTARGGLPRKNCVFASDMQSNDGEHHSDRVLVSQGKTTSQLSSSDTMVLLSNENDGTGPCDLAGFSRSPPESSSASDLRTCPAPNNSHQKQTLAEFFVKQLSHGNGTEISDCHGKADEWVNYVGTKIHASCSRDYPLPGNQRVSERRASDCDGGGATKRDSKPEKLGDYLTGFPQPQPSKSISCKTPTEGATRDGCHYSIVSCSSGDSKNSTFAKSLMKTDHTATTWSTSSDGRRLTVEGKHSKNRIPEAGSLSGVAAVGSPRGSRKSSDVDHFSHMLKDPSNVGTSCSSLSVTRPFPGSERTRPGETHRDQPSNPSSSLLSIESTLPEEPSGRSRHKSDIVDIDNLNQMKRYYMTKHRKQDEFKGSSKIPAEPNLEKYEPSVPTNVKSLDSKQHKPHSGLTVPWCDSSNSAEAYRQEDPRTLSSKTYRVTAVPFSNDLASSAPVTETSKRSRALSLPLPKFAHWTRSSSADHDAKKRRFSIETSFRSASKSVCSAGGILSPHHSPNPTKSENTSFGFTSDSKTVDGVLLRVDETNSEDVESGAGRVPEHDRFLPMEKPGDDEKSSNLKADIKNDSAALDVIEVTGMNTTKELPAGKKLTESHEETFEANTTECFGVSVDDQNNLSFVGVASDQSLVAGKDGLGKIETNSDDDRMMKDEGFSENVGKEFGGKSETDSRDVKTTGESLSGTPIGNGCTEGGKHVSDALGIDDSVIKFDIPLNSESVFEKLTTSDSDSEVVLNAAALEIIDNKVAGDFEESKICQQDVAMVTQSSSVSLVAMVMQTPSSVSLVQGVDDVSTAMCSPSLESVPTVGVGNCSLPPSAEERSTEPLTLNKEGEPSKNSVEIEIPGSSCGTSDQCQILSKSRNPTFTEPTSSKSTTELPKRETTEKPRNGNSVAETSNVQSFDRLKALPKMNEKAKIMQEIAGVKRKADAAFLHQDQTRKKNNSAEDSSSKRKKEADGGPSVSKVMKIDETDVKKQDVTKSKEQAKSDKTDKTNHRPKISACSVKPKVSAHSTIKKDCNERHTAHIPNSSLSKAVDSDSDVRKKSNSSSDGNSKSHSHPRSYDAGDCAEKGGSDVLKSHDAHRKSSHREDGRKMSISSESKKSTDSSDKAREHRSKMSRPDAKSSKFEAGNKDQSLERKPRHDDDSNSRRPTDVKVSEEKSVKSHDKARENLKSSDAKPQKASERRKEDEKLAEVGSTKHDRRNSIEHHPMSSKPSNGEKRSEHRSHGNAASAAKTSATKKPDSCSSSSVSNSVGTIISKTADHSAERGKHSHSVKGPSDSCKPQDGSNKDRISVVSNKCSDPENRTKSNSLTDHSKQTGDVCGVKQSIEGSKNLEKNSKNLADVKKDRKHSKEFLSDNFGKNSSKTTYGKGTEPSKPAKRSDLPVELDRCHSRKNSSSHKVSENSPTCERVLDSGNNPRKGNGFERDGNGVKEKSSKDNKFREKSQKSTEKFSSLDHKTKPIKSDRKSKDRGTYREQESSLVRNADEEIRSSAGKKEKSSSKRPEEKRELKALLQEQDEELMLAPYMSMYDMVKRRSNKEREKEEAAKIEQLRSKTLNKLQASRCRQRKKSTVSIDENSVAGSDASKFLKFRSKKNKQRKSSYDEQHFKQSWSNDSSSLSSSLSSLSSSLDNDDKEKDIHYDDDPVKPSSLKMPSHSQKVCDVDSDKSEDSSSNSSDEECLPAHRRQSSSSRPVKKTSLGPQRQKKWNNTSVYAASDSEEEKEPSHLLTSKKVKPVAGRTSNYHSSISRESLTGASRKEKLRKFALFSSSSSSSSTESSDNESRVASSTHAKAWNRKSNSQEKDHVNKSDRQSVTSSFKDGSNSNAASPEVALKTAKVVKGFMERSTKKSEHRSKIESLGSSSEKIAKPLPSNNFVSEPLESKAKSSEQDFSKQSRKSDVQKDTIAPSAHSHKSKVTKSLCKIDGLWIEERVSEKKQKTSKTLFDHKSKSTKERNSSTKTKPSDRVEKSDNVSMDGVVTKPTDDEITEKSFEKSRARVFPEARHSRERSITCWPKEPTREDTSRSSSYTRLDNIFEKMEQNDGRKERELLSFAGSLREPPCSERKELEKMMQVDEEESVGITVEVGKEKEIVQENMTVEDLESSELTQDSCDELHIGPKECNSKISDEAFDNVISDVSRKTEINEELIITENFKVDKCKGNDEHCLEIKDDGDDFLLKSDEKNSFGETLSAAQVGTSEDDVKMEKMDTDDEILVKLQHTTNDHQKSTAIKGELAEEKFGFDLVSSTEQRSPSSIDTGLIYSPKEQLAESSDVEEGIFPGEKLEEIENLVPMNMKYAEEKEQLGIDEDSVEEFQIDEVQFTSVDPRTEKREYFIDRVSSSDLPMQFSCPTPSFLDLFVWVKPASPITEMEKTDEPTEIEPIKDEPCDQLTTEDCSTSIKSTDILPLESAPASPPGDTTMNKEIEGHTTEDTAVGVTPDAVDMMQSDENKMPEVEENNIMVEPTGVVPITEGSVCTPEPEVSKCQGRRLIAKFEAGKKTVAGEKATRPLPISAGMQSTPKGAILRTRLQGNVEIVESFSSRGRKIIPKDRDRDFMQIGSKCVSKIGLSVLGGGTGRGRARRGKFAPNVVEVRPGRKVADIVEGTDESQGKDENDEKLSLRASSIVANNRQLNFGSSHRGRRMESLRSNSFVKSNAQDVATLTIARKYGRSPAIRGVCQKTEAGTAKSLVIQLNKIAMPSGGAKRTAIWKGKKEESMAVNGVKDLYEFEDEDEIGPIPEYKHKRPLKRTKDSPPAEVTKSKSRTEEDESAATTSEPVPKRPKRMVKGRSRGRHAKSKSKTPRGKKIATRSQADEVVIAVSNESCASLASAGTEEKSDAGAVKLLALDEPSSQPRHLPLKLEMKEQRHAAAASVASNASGRRGFVDAFFTSDDKSSATAGVTDVCPKPSVVAEEVQSNVERVINDVASGNIECRGTLDQSLSDVDCFSRISSSQQDLEAKGDNSSREHIGPQMLEDPEATLPASCCLQDNSSDAMDATVIYRQNDYKQSSEKVSNLDFKTTCIQTSSASGDVCHQMSPLTVTSRENSLPNKSSGYEDVNREEDLTQERRGAVEIAAVHEIGSRGQPPLDRSSKSINSDEIQLFMGQSAQFACQRQQISRDSAASLSQNSFLPLEFIPGQDQHCNVQASNALSRPDARTAPSTLLPSQAHPPTAAVAPHFADSYLTPGVSGIRHDARGCHAAQSPVAGVYPQPIYSNLRLLSYLHIGADIQSYERMLMAVNQQQQQLMSQGLLLPPGVVSVLPHEVVTDKHPDQVAVHRPSSVSVTPPADQLSASSAKMDPAAFSRLHPEHTDLLFLLLKKYPVVWQGLLSLKNDFSAVQMHYVAGNRQLVKLSLPESSQLRLSQRMRLEPSQLEQVSKRMMNSSEYCMLVALPCGQDHLDIIMQSNNLRAGFISYLQQKQAAGIVNIIDPTSSQTAYVVHIFPPCHFTSEHLVDHASDLLLSINDMSYLLVVIATV